MKKDRFITPIRLGAIGALAVLLLLVEMVIALPIILATGVIGAAGFIMLLLGPMILVLSRLILNRFGSATLVGLVFGILVLGLPVLGPPGFIFKLLIMLVAGLGADIGFVFLRNHENQSALLSGVISAYLVAAMVFGTFKLFLPTNVPNVFSNPTAVIVLVILLTPLGLLAGYFARKIYDLIKDREIIQRVRS